MNILSKISERLKDLMNEAELNKSEFAKRSKISLAVISRILSRERTPSYDTFIKIVEYFNCPADYLVGNIEIWNEQIFNPCPPFNERLSFLLNYYNTSKYKLEQDTGLQEETVNRWHKGKYDPRVEHIIDLSKYFKCSVDFILGRTDFENY